MSIIGWALAAALFLSPIIVSGLLVWQSHQERGIEYRTMECRVGRDGDCNIKENAHEQE